MPLRSALLRAALDAALDAASDALTVLSPVQCAGCGAADRALCGACRALLTPHPRQRDTPGGLLVVSALAYDGVARRVILALKEQGRTDAAGTLATALAAAILSAAAAVVTGEVELVVPPSSRAGRRRRGFDPVSTLLDHAGFPPPSPVLLRSRSTAAQKSLDREHRAANTVGSLAARGPLKGRTFLVVDDVLTTGATLDETVRAISVAGGSVLVGAVVAFTPLRSEARTMSAPGTERDSGTSAGIWLGNSDGLVRGG